MPYDRAVRTGVTIVIDRHVAGPYADATSAALAHAGGGLGVELSVREVPTRRIDQTLIDHPEGGLVIGPGSPYDEPEAVLEAIRSARQRGVPLVGT